MSLYTRYRTLAEAKAEAARHDAFLSRRLVVPTPGELERERETLRLRAEFCRLDMIVCDELSVTRDVRSGRKLRSWA